ncbi:MAG TPA: dihydrofolate reductase [Bacteroidales bacterium]|jgi:dihydrofolate reductase|nr:dihydrofolate reductase [Bacteroidales bacterium]MDY0160127.1 dihydrofolate reductase [Bacteroidales bacterium]HXK81609.1 dihydrofolate reductase [Bacteroidales bacterium]
MSFSIIVAVAENYAIGANNDLLWYIPEDLKRFKKITTGNTIIMGKKTFESLPNGPLPNRRNIVISDIKNDCVEGCIVVDSIQNAIEACKPNEENFIIGGGSIYKQFLDIADKIYLTKVHRNYDADVFFPKIDFNNWITTFKESHKENNPPYTYLILNRKK